MDFMKQYGFTVLTALSALTFAGFGGWLLMLGQVMGAVATLGLAGGFGFMVYRDVQTKMLNK